jgi:hypothetical protein
MESDNRNADLKYADITKQEVFDLMRLFEEEFKNFLQVSNYPKDLEYSISRRNIIEVIVRVDKRDAYFHCFHDIEMSERKSASLYAYWLLKFKPFFITDNRFLDKESGSQINEAFAIYLISSILFFSNKLTPSKEEKVTYYKKLMYAFKYRNISIDAMLLLVESINTETFGKIYTEIV